MRLTSKPLASAASSGSQSEPQITLMTFQPAPRKTASSSWMILPLPRTGPSSRCRLQLTTQIRLSRRSRAARVSAPSVSGSSVSPSPTKHQTLRLLPVGQSPGAHVAVEPGLVNGHDRPQSHRHGRELPELRHQVRMRIRRQPAALGQFLPEMVQMPLVQAPFQIGPRIDARRGVTLEVNHVRRPLRRAAAEEMVEAHLVKRGAGGIGGNVPAHAGVTAVGVDHHGHGVPANVALDAALESRDPRGKAAGPLGEWC